MTILEKCLNPSALDTRHLFPGHDSGDDRPTDNRVVCSTAEAVTGTHTRHVGNAKNNTRNNSNNNNRRRATTTATAAAAESYRADNRNGMATRRRP